MAVYREDVTWLVGLSTTPQPSFDSSQSAISLPRRVPANRGCSFQLFDPTQAPSGANGSIAGALSVSASNAPVVQDRLVEPAFWVHLPDLDITIGSSDPLPTLQQILFPACGWVRLTWTPNSSQGTLAGRFDGPRP